MTSTKSPASVTVVQLIHDLVQHKAYAALVWDADPTKSLTLPVPFATNDTEAREAAEQALRELSAETATLVVNLPA